MPFAVISKSFCGDSRPGVSVSFMTSTLFLVYMAVRVVSLNLTSSASANVVIAEGSEGLC